MPIFRYSVKHSNGEADGSIDAPDAGEAEARLRRLFSHESLRDGFVDAKGKKIDHEVTEVQLEQVS